MSYELFDIKDKETHEYIRDLTREQPAVATRSIADAFKVMGLPVSPAAKEA